MNSATVRRHTATSAVAGCSTAVTPELQQELMRVQPLAAMFDLVRSK